MNEDEVKNSVVLCLVIVIGVFIVAFMAELWSLMIVKSCQSSLEEKRRWNAGLSNMDMQIRATEYAKDRLIPRPVPMASISQSAEVTFSAEN